MYKFLEKCIAGCLAGSIVIFPYMAKSEPGRPISEIIDRRGRQAFTQEKTDFAREYILGPGDRLLIEVLDVPEYSGTFGVGPNGIIFLPGLEPINASGLTIEELKDLIIERLSNFVISPSLFVTPIAYRPIRVYVGGEIERPGYYYMTGIQGTSYKSPRQNFEGNDPVSQYRDQIRNRNLALSSGNRFTDALINPTIFDALRAAGGVTPFSNLTEVSVTRRLPRRLGNKALRTQVNFWSFISTGSNEQNIALVDGDTVYVPRSPKAIRDQIIQASRTNLSPQEIRVIVSGRVRNPGTIILRQGATLEQALSAAGGTKILRGTIEFIRFNSDGSSDARQILGTGNKPAGSYTNPVLMAGDLIRVNDSPLTAISSIIGEITSPALGIYSTYAIIDGFQNED